MAPKRHKFLDSMSGKTIHSDRYLLLECLGAGSYGQVYKAVDTSTLLSNPIHYAVKVMPKHEPNTRHAKMQTRELTIHQDISNHPNIVGVHEVIQPDDDDYIYLVLDLCSGGDLKTSIKNRSFIGHDESVKNVFLQIIEAVEHCHSRGVYHRDLKPDNILLSEDSQRVFLADFGLASTQESSRSFGCGTPIFMSPECIGSSPSAMQNLCYAHRANDIWALGIILANMISGCYPWMSAHPSDSCFKLYCQDHLWLYNHLDISVEAFRLLERIFDIDASARMTLPEMKQAVQNMPTFFCEPGKKVKLTAPLMGSTVYELGVKLDEIQAHRNAGKGASANEPEVVKPPRKRTTRIFRRLHRLIQF